MEKELLEFLTARNYEEAANIANKYEPSALAELLVSLPEEHLIPFCHVLDSELLAEVILLLDAALQEQILSGLRDDELEKVMDEISVDETVDIIEEMPQEIVRRIAELDDILMLLEERNYAVLKPLLSSMNAIDLAEVFEETEKDTDLLILFRILPKDLASETFVEMDSDVKERLIHKLTDSEIRRSDSVYRRYDAAQNMIHTMILSRILYAHDITHALHDTYQIMVPRAVRTYRTHIIIRDHHALTAISHLIPQAHYG